MSTAHLGRTAPVLSISIALAVSACGGAQPAPEAPPPQTSEETVPPEEPPGPEAEPSASDDVDSEMTETAELEPAEDPNEIRDVVYKMTPEGLEIEVDGVKFLPKAQPVKVAGGAWGVKITMEAEGVGDTTRYLLTPKGGVLAFAGSVKRKGQVEEFGDKRDGRERVAIAPGEKKSFESTWPKDKSQNALWWGNELSMEAGLWGLGKTEDTLRPVRQFFTLRMIAGNKPQPVLQPPKSAQ